MKTNSTTAQKTPEKNHSDQYKYQVLLPILAVVLVCVVVCLVLLVGCGGNTQSTRLWSDISIIFLMFSGILSGLLFFLLIWLLFKLFTKWNIALPIPLRNLRNHALRLNLKVRNTAHKPAQMLIGIKAFFSGIRSIFSR